MKKILYFLLFISIFAYVKPVHAYSFSAHLSPKAQVSNGFQFEGYDYYRYMRVVTQADSSDSNYSISFVGSKNVSGLNLTPAIGTLNVKCTGTKQYVVYILPRVGMSCPLDATYCFGAGKNDNSTTLIQGNECDGGWCNLYGVRIKNNKLYKDYNINVTYEFFR